MFDQLQSHSDLSDKVEKKKTSSSSLHCRANRKQAQKFIFGSKLTNNNNNKNTTTAATTTTTATTAAAWTLNWVKNFTSEVVWLETSKRFQLSTYLE